jgi:hypothetical protein
MPEVQDNPWDELDINSLPSAPDPIGDIPLFYEDPNDIQKWINGNNTSGGLLNLLWRGSVCTCGAGASHAMCVAVPALTGGVTGGAGALLTGGAMYVLSPVFAIAANAGLDRWQNIRRDAASQIRSMAITTVAAIGITGGINWATGHEHLDHGVLDSLSAEQKIAWLAQEQELYDNMPPALQEAVKAAAEAMELSAAEYITICSGTDELGQEIVAFRREWQAEQLPKFTLEP